MMRNGLQYRTIFVLGFDFDISHFFCTTSATSKAKKAVIVNISETAKDMNINFGVQVRIIKSHHFAKFEQNRFKNISSNREKLDFGKMLKTGEFQN